MFQCAYDQMSPCYNEYYLNRYDVLVFEKEYEVGTTFDCFYFKYNTSWVQSNKYLHALSIGMITNCYLWPSMVLLICLIWFIVAIVEIWRKRRRWYTGKDMSSRHHCRHEGGKCRLMSQTFNHDSAGNIHPVQSRPNAKSQIIGFWSQTHASPTHLGHHVTHSFPKARIAPFHIQEFIREEDELDLSSDDGTVIRA